MFVRIIQKSRLKMPLLLTMTILAIVVLLKWPQAAATGVSRGLSICTTVIIPSLFPFLVVSGFLIKSGAAAYLGRRLEKPTRWLFGLPGCAATAILIGMLGGYPAGSVAVRELLEQGCITREQAKRLLRFCVCGGPAFIISAVGVGMLGSRPFGILLFVSHILSALIIGILGRKQSVASQTEAPSTPTMPATAALVESVNGACRSMLYMCGFVVLFAAILSLADAIGVTDMFNRWVTAPFAGTTHPTSPLRGLFPSLFEVSCGCLESAASGAASPMMLGLAIGWGGLSVHCQIAATVHRHRLIDSGFWGARLLHGVLTGTLAMVLFHIWPVSIQTGGNQSGAIVRPFAGSAISAVALLMVCGMLLLVTENGGTKYKLHIAKRK